jgi:hypothetical protein
VDVALEEIRQALCAEFRIEIEALGIGDRTFWAMAFRHVPALISESGGSARARVPGGRYPSCNLTRRMGPSGMVIGNRRSGACRE